MDRDELMSRVVERGPFDSPDQAEAAVMATLTAIGARVGAGAARNLASTLPEEVGQHLTAGAAQADPSAAGASVTADGDARPFGADQLAARVADQTGAEPEVARGQAGAVLTAIRDAAPQDAWAGLVAQLPSGFVDDLVGR